MAEELKSSNEKVSAALSGLKCMAIWLRSVHLDTQADDLDSYREDLETVLRPDQWVQDGKVFP